MEQQGRSIGSNDPRCAALSRGVRRAGFGPCPISLRCGLMKAIAALVVLSSILVACGDDDQSTPDNALAAEERDWCTLKDGTEESALRFDDIFEAGLLLDLPMDEVNARAVGLLAEYEAQGMSTDEAVRAVSEDLLKDEDFVTACKDAYAFATDG